MLLAESLYLGNLELLRVFRETNLSSGDERRMYKRNRSYWWKNHKEDPEVWEEAAQSIKMHAALQ